MSRTNRISQNVADKSSMSGRELQIALDRMGNASSNIGRQTGSTITVTTEGSEIIQRLTLWGFWAEANICPNPDTPSNWADTEWATYYRIVIVHTDNDCEFNAKLQYASVSEGGVFADADTNALTIDTTGTLDISEWFELPEGCRGTEFAYKLDVTKTAGADPVEITEMFIEFKGTVGQNTVVGIAGPQGPTGATGATGPAGAAGAAGPGVPTGGTADQVLAKVDGTDYNTYWKNDATGGGSTPKATATVRWDKWTPGGTGLDTNTWVVPHVAGVSKTWNCKLAIFRVETPGGAPAVTLLKATGPVFGSTSPTALCTLTMGSGGSQVSTTSFAATVTSGLLLRVTVDTLGTASDWTVQLELEEV